MPSEPMTDERLAELEAEVERLRGVDREWSVLRMFYDQKVRLLDDVAPVLLSDPDLWDTMKRERDEALARAEKAEAEVERLRYTLEQLNKRVRGAVFPENVRTAVRAENWRALWDAIDAAEAMLEAHTDD